MNFCILFIFIHNQQKSFNLLCSNTKFHFYFQKFRFHFKIDSLDFPKDIKGWPEEIKSSTKKIRNGP